MLRSVSVRGCQGLAVHGRAGGAKGGRGCTGFRECSPTTLRGGLMVGEGLASGAQGVEG